MPIPPWLLGWATWSAAAVAGYGFAIAAVAALTVLLGWIVHHAMGWTLLALAAALLLGGWSPVPEPTG